MKILPLIAGVLIISGILLEAFETIVLPRRVTRRFRLTRLYYRVLWIPWRRLAHGIKSSKAREGFMSYFGPLSLLGLFALWAAMLIVGFGFLYFSDARVDQTHPTLETCFYLSGTTFFTLGLGDVTPHTAAERVLAVCESGLGFGFLALVLSYLPVIYQAFSRREVAIVLLDARAGSPPTASRTSAASRRCSRPRSVGKASARLGALGRGTARESRVLSGSHVLSFAAQQRVLALGADRNARHFCAGHFRRRRSMPASGPAYVCDLPPCRRGFGSSVSRLTSTSRRKSLA